MNFRRFASLLLMPAALMPLARTSSAAAWQQAAIARVSTEYDTNPAMTPTNPQGVSRHLFEPSYTLTGNFDRDVLRTGLALQLARSSNESLSPHRNSPTAFLDWVRQNETGEFGITSRYSETSTRNVDTNIAGNTDPALAENTRSSRTLSARWRNAFSESSTLEANGSYESVSYSAGTLRNYATRSAGMMYSYLWSDASTPFIRMMRTEYEAASNTVPSNFINTVLAGLNWTASETLTGTLQAGQSKVSNIDETTAQGGASVRYAGERNQLNFNANRQVTPTGLGGFTTVDQVNGSWSYALSEHSNTGIDLVGQNSKYITDISNRSSSVWLQHELNSFWGVRTYYRHYTLSRDGFADASSDILGLSLSYTHTDF